MAVRLASIRRRKELKLSTPRGRDKFLEAVVQRYDLWGTNVETFFRLKALCIMKRKEKSIV